MLVGAGVTGALFEVGVMESDDVPVAVHAMAARVKFLSMTVPRTVQEILDHGDELAARFEAYEPEPGDERDPEAIVALRSAALVRAVAERSLQQAVLHAREQHYSWQVIGCLLGTSGEAARQRYRTRRDA